MMEKKHATNSQINFLVDYMVRHSDLASNKVDVAQGRNAAEKMWQELADELNAMGGAMKSVDKWRQTKTDSELKQEFVKTLMMCTKENPVEMSELFNLEKRIVPKDKNVKCLLACVYRKTGQLNEKGLFDLKKAYELAASLNTPDNDTREAKGRKLSDICVKVNEAPTNDKEKGCERATMIFKCVVEEAPKLGFKL